MEHHHHTHSYGKLTAHATAHCLIGCGLGEVVGFSLGIALGLSNLVSIVIGVTLGFVFGFALGIVPLVKVGKTPYEAFRLIFLGEFVSISFMETAEVTTQIYFPGVMDGSVVSPIFWLGMLVSLIAGYIVAYPINYFMIKKGLNHHHH